MLGQKAKKVRYCIVLTYNTVLWRPAQRYGGSNEMSRIADPKISVCRPAVRYRTVNPTVSSIGAGLSRYSRSGAFCSTHLFPISENLLICLSLWLCFSRSLSEDIAFFHFFSLSSPPSFTIPSFGPLCRRLVLYTDPVSCCLFHPFNFLLVRCSKVHCLSYTRPIS